ncbi:unnamed protein product [Caenorhabditis nigoni]
MQLFIIYIFLLFASFSECQITPTNSTSPNILCDICNSGLSIVQSQLSALESIVENNLGALVKKMCDIAPTNIPIVKAFCVVLQDDLVDALITLIKGLKDQTSPSLLCGYLKV